MKLENEMLGIAIKLLDERFGADAGCVAVIRIETGEFLTSIYSPAICDSANLCAETGAICEAHKLNKKLLIRFAFIGTKMPKSSKYYRHAESVRNACDFLARMFRPQSAQKMRKSFSKRWMKCSHTIGISGNNKGAKPTRRNR